MGEDNSTGVVPIKAVENRRADGTFGVGNIANPHGRPKKGMTLTDVARDILEENLPSGVTKKEALVRQVAKLAYEGNETMIKLLWSYIDGMPRQRNEVELSGGIGVLTYSDVLRILKGEKIEDEHNTGTELTESN